ncbi:MAG: phosphoribosyltransferase family protein, partial [Pseudomonadota bacterium]
RAGAEMAKIWEASGIQADVVMPVPDSACTAAQEMARVLGLPYREGLVKNRYVGRTFIMPGQGERKKSVRRKLNAIPPEFKDRNVLLIDDSIVRGNTMRKIVQMCREAGARQVFVASASPPVKFPNVYGIDMPTKAELIANGKSVDEIQAEIGCDALIYQRLEDMIWAAQQGNPKIERFDCSCFDGDYITGSVGSDYLETLESAGSVRPAEADDISWKRSRLASVS